MVMITSYTTCGRRGNFVGQLRTKGMRENSVRFGVHSAISAGQQLNEPTSWACFDRSTARSEPGANARVRALFAQPGVESQESGDDETLEAPWKVDQVEQKVFRLSQRSDCSISNGNQRPFLRANEIRIEDLNGWWSSRLPPLTLMPSTHPTLPDSAFGSPPPNYLQSG